MTDRISISIGILRQVIRHDPDTGHLFWLTRQPWMFKNSNRPAEWNCRSWNAKYAGKRAFTAKMEHDGIFYHVGSIFSQSMRAHRVVWALHYGVWPSDDLDHVNGNGLQNSINNLRDVDNQENHKNTIMHKTNTSGFNGVTWCKRTNRWRAMVKINYKTKCLGRYVNFDDAVKARIDANELYGFSDRHGK